MSVAARESALVAAGKPMHELRWRLDIENGIATLTIPTFAFWNDSFDWADFLEQAFARIRAEGVEHLILDLRDNEGGDSAIGDALIARIIETPLEIAPSRMISAYERAPYILVRYLDTWNFDFFDRTGQVRKLADGRWELLDQPKAKRIEPVADPFRGRVVMLTGPRMSSAGFLIARDFKRTRRGVLIGRATGGSLRGLNGGELTWLTLPASNVAVDIPLLAGFMPGADSDTPPPDRGIKPDQVIETRFDDAAAGRDPEHAAAVRWLRAGA
jgi:C-terminal processing protease CtpA/Prc